MSNSEESHGGFWVQRGFGVVREGMAADMVTVRGDLLSDLDLFTDPDNLRLVVKGGRVAKDIR